MSYRGEIKLRFKWIPNSTAYNVDERIGQLVILPYPEVQLELVEELSSSERGEGGYGSTGK